MNKGLKLLVKIGLGCCLVGTALCLVGWVSGADIGAAINSDTVDIEYDDKYIDVDTSFMENLYTNEATETWPLEEFENISAELYVGDLVICRDETFSLTLVDSQYDFAVDEIEYEVKDGTLYLKELEEERNTDLQVERKIEIHVPKGQKLGSVSVNQNQGNVTFYSLDMQTLDVYSNIGKIRLNNMEMDSLKVNNGEGEVFCTALRVYENTEISNESGDTEILGDFLGDVRLNNGTGHMEVSLRTEMDQYYKVVEGESKGLSTSYTRKYDPSTHPTFDPNAPNRLTIKNDGGTINFNC